MPLTGQSPVATMRERRAVGADVDGVRRDRAVACSAPSGRRSAGRSSAPTTSGANVAEVDGHRLRQRPRRFPDRVGVPVVHTVDGEAGPCRWSRSRRPDRRRRRSAEAGRAASAACVRRPSGAHLGEAGDDRVVSRPSRLGGQLSRKFAHRGSIPRGGSSTITGTLIRPPTLGAQNQSLPPAALIFCICRPGRCCLRG